MPGEGVNRNVEYRSECSLRARICRESLLIPHSGEILHNIYFEIILGIFKIDF